MGSGAARHGPCGYLLTMSGRLSDELNALRFRHGLPIDREISFAVKVLQDAGIETYESCEGGEGHAFPEPAIRFHGSHVQGYRAVTVAMECGLPVAELRRFWSVIDGELTGPTWEMTFHPKSRLIEVQRQAEGEIPPG
jgi:hypothetical protein